MTHCLQIKYFAWMLVALALGEEQGHKIQAKFTRPLPIDEVLARVDAERDTWIGERDYEAIHRKLDEIATRLREGKETFAPLDVAARRFASLSVIELKVVSSARARAEETEARIGLRVELAGREAQGNLLSLLGPWSSRWERSAGDWRLA